MHDAAADESAPCATRAEDSCGRAHPEPEDAHRSAFAVDRHRIICSTAFRRLDRKTQVFGAAVHDHFRTRLTHTLEAAEIARTLASALRANTALAEAITLAHDLGHPPFGHAGEAALNQAMADRGGFNHNAHALRVVEHLERPFPAFPGLNLTEATRSGLAVHQTRYDQPETPCGVGGGIEAQIASLADRVAYNLHDLEDAIGAEFVGFDELEEASLWARACSPWRERYPGHVIHALRRPVLNQMLDTVLADVIHAASVSLEAGTSTGRALSADCAVVRASPEMEAELAQLEAVLASKVYARSELAEADAEGRRRILALFAFYREKPNALPERYARRIDDEGAERVICDYIAGMTDRFCAEAYEQHRGER